MSRRSNHTSRSILTAALLAVIAAGCASPRIVTPSGRPEVTITGVPHEKVRGEMINYFINRKFTPKSSDNLVSVFEKQADGLTSFLHGSMYDPRAFIRISLTLLPVGHEESRVMAVPSIVTNVRSAYEKDNEMTGVWVMQRQLELIKSNLESGKPADAGMDELNAELKIESMSRSKSEPLKRGQMSSNPAARR